MRQQRVLIRIIGFLDVIGHTCGDGFSRDFLAAFP
jgi:hypothetical protein